MNDIESLSRSSVSQTISMDEQISEFMFFLKTFQRTSTLALQMSASFTIGMQIVILVSFLSRINRDEEHIAAISLITSMINATILIGSSPLFTIGNIVSEELGAVRDAITTDTESLQLKRDHLSAVVRNGLLVSSVMVPPMILSLVFSKTILRSVFNQNEQVAEIAQSFLRPYAINVPGMMFRLLTEQVIFGFARTKHAMIISLTDFVTCMSIGGILAFGALGSPKLANTGILIGCIAETYLTASAYSLYIAKNPRFELFHFFNFSRPLAPYLDQLQAICKAGGACFLTMTIETVMSFVISALAGVLGTNQQAAITTIMQITLFSTLLQIAFGQTCANEISRAIGEKQYKIASRLGKYGLISSTIFTTPTPLILASYPPLLMSIIGSDNESIAQILHYLAPIIFVGSILDSVRFNLLQQLRVLDDAKVSALVSSTCLTIGMGLSALLGLKSNLGIYGVGIGYSTGILMATLCLFTRWLPRIEPKAIEENRKNDIQSNPLANCCSAFFNRLICVPEPVISQGIELQRNPLHRKFDL